MFGPGDTFYGGSELHGRNHLWIVINDPARHDGLALYVNITSLKGGRFDDLTCVLQRGEHVAANHPSYSSFPTRLSDFNCSRVALRGLGELRVPAAPLAGAHV